jgi:hypothetical protein
MSPRAAIRHRRPHWVVSGACWALLVLADLAILSFWAAVSTVLLALGCAGGVVLRRRRLLAAAGTPVVTGPAGAPVDPTPTDPLPAVPPAASVPPAAAGPAMDAEPGAEGVR